VGGCGRDRLLRGAQDAPDDFSAARIGIYLSVADLDAHHERARDPEGLHWHFGTYVPQAAAASPDSV
jgi:hypothetical protein